jgi:DNA-binding NarL/FixJ family response regulator
VAAKVVGAVGRGRGRGGTLTEREREVLRLVADGLQNKQIGRALGISERTVKYHLTAILTRLGADNRAQAVAIATGRGLLDVRGRE